MKLRILALLVAQTLCRALVAGDSIGSFSTAVPVTAREKAAMENFQKDVDGVTRWIKEKQKTVPADPAAAMAMVTEVVAKFKAIKADGLPADLKGAWGEMTTVMGELGEVFKGMPTGKGDKPEDAMNALGEIMPKLMALQEKVAPIAKKLEEVGTKYGLDLSKVGPDK